MSGVPILSLMSAVPLVAGDRCACSSSARGARWIALAATLADLALGIVLWASYDIGGRAVAVHRAGRASAAASPGRSASTASR